MRKDTNDTRFLDDGRVEYRCSACGRFWPPESFGKSYGKKDSRRGFVCHVCGAQCHGAKSEKLFLSRYTQTSKSPRGKSLSRMLQDVIVDQTLHHNLIAAAFRRLQHAGAKRNAAFMARFRPILLERIASKCFRPTDAIWLVFRPGFLDDASALLWALGYALFASKLTRLNQEADVSIVFEAVRAAAMSGDKRELTLATNAAHDIYVQSEKPTFSPAARRVALALTAFEREPQDAAYAVISGCAEGLVLLGKTEEEVLLSIYDVLLVVAGDAATVLKDERHENAQLLAKAFEGEEEA